MIFIIIILVSNIAFSQDIPAGRITDWNNPGSALPFSFQNSVSLSLFDADTTGILPSDNAFQQALNALNCSGEIYVPKGIYLFEQTIILPDSVIIRGETDSISLFPLARFRFAAGESNHGIKIGGTENNSNYILTYPLQQGEQKLFVSQPGLFSPGDFIRLKTYDDSSLVSSVWAYHTTGQIFQILQVDGDSLFLDKPLRRSYSGIYPPVIYKLQPGRQVHIKCIEIERLDATVSQTSNIYFEYASDCSVSGVASYNCNNTHIKISFSTRITIENSFFRDAFAYGGGGQGYGIEIQFASGCCYVHQNIFQHLRHSMLLSSGANGNVLAYNYSFEPFWEEYPLPANAAGDLVLHGNYPYMNLMEGNIVQNIVIDNSHGINGPFNTFHRNRAEKYGIFMNTNPSSGMQNFIGNQVTDTTGAPLGLYMLQGNNHFEFGNMIKGVVVPGSTGEPNTVSLFNYYFNPFYTYHSSIPPVRNDNWKDLFPFIEAQYRYLISDKKAICNTVIYENPSFISETAGDKITIYPNPNDGKFQLSGITHPCSVENIKIYNLLGEIVYQVPVSAHWLPVSITTGLSPGIYFLNWLSKGEEIEKMIIISK